MGLAIFFFFVECAFVIENGVLMLAFTSDHEKSCTRSNLLWKIHSYVDFSHYLRKFFPNIKIAVGGAFPSTLPEVCKEDCSVNIVVKGAGETAFLDIANNIDSYNNYGGGDNRRRNTARKRLHLT